MRRYCLAPRSAPATTAHTTRRATAAEAARSRRTTSGWAEAAGRRHAATDTWLGSRARTGAAAGRATTGRTGWRAARTAVRRTAAVPGRHPGLMRGHSRASHRRAREFIDRLHRLDPQAARAFERGIDDHAGIGRW